MTGNKSHNLQCNDRHCQLDETKVIQL